MTKPTDSRKNPVLFRSGGNRVKKFVMEVPPITQGSLVRLPTDSKKQKIIKKKRDNPDLNRFIVIGTKALRRELMSGETLRAPRQQLRRLRASAFDLSLKHYQRRATSARLLFCLALRPEPNCKGSL